MSVFDVLKERGFIQQKTHEDEIKQLLEKEKVTFYIGFDPTADSLHFGHLLQLIVMRHMQDHGHRPIALLGGGTAMVGDPTGKTDMRKMLTREDIARNAAKFKTQMERLLDFSAGKAIMADNADWLLKLNYVEFLREIGVHFNVNRMLAAECFKMRMEKGLSFLEFNYMVMQGYDFLELYRRYGCTLQLGGDDQWSNIIAGAELVRKVEAKPVYGMTFTLLTTVEGTKMGKTESGAVWLDPDKTSPYDFYQHWRNVDDKQVAQSLALMTFLPMDEVRRLSALKDREINDAKKILAFEVTKIAHGEAEAKKAQDAAGALFEGGSNFENAPTIEVNEIVSKRDNIVTFMNDNKITSSKSDGMRRIKEGSVRINKIKLTNDDIGLTLFQLYERNNLQDTKIILQKGQKHQYVIVFTFDILSKIVK